MDTINETVKTARQRVRRAAKETQRDVREAVSQAARNGDGIVVAIDHAQRQAAEFGRSVQRNGQRAMQRTTETIAARPMLAAALLGGAILAGASAYLIASARRR